VIDEAEPTRTVSVRELSTGDAAGVVAMVGRCGPETLYRRFLGPRRDAAEVLAAELRRGRLRGCALGAVAGGRLVGVASLAAAVETWEAAVMVEDAWQGRGVGRALARRLAAAAAERGADTVRLVTLVETATAVRALVRDAGWRVAGGDAGGGVLDLVTEPA
jgi:GNAT superfamily N-acetyltransferase